MANAARITRGRSRCDKQTCRRRVIPGDRSGDWLGPIDPGASHAIRNGAGAHLNLDEASRDARGRVEFSAPFFI